MSERLYALLLLLYPRAFRERYSAEMLQLFRERLRDERAVRVWIDVLADALISIPRQHLVRGPHPIIPPSAATLLATVQTMLGRTFVLSGVCLVAVFYSRGGMWPLTLAASCLWLVVMWNAVRTSRMIKTYAAEVRGDSVTVACAGLGMAPLTLRRSEVVGLHVFEKLGLRVRTADPARDLWVPSGAPSYADVRGHLSDWAPVTVTPFGLVSSPEYPSVPALVVICALVLLLPMPIAAGIAAGLMPRLVWAIVKRNVPTRRFLLPLVPAAIVLVRWLF